MLKKILAVLSLIFILQTPAMANENYIKGLLNQDSVAVSQEKNEVENLYTADPSKNETSSIIKTAFGQRKMKLNGSHEMKAYGLNDDLVSGYRDGKKFEDMITNKYEWDVPILNESLQTETQAIITKGISVEEAAQSGLKFADDADKQEYLNIVKLHAGKWFIAAIGLDVPVSEIEFITDKEQVAKFLEDAGITNPSTVKYVKTGRFFTNILYVKQGNEEYGIPFSNRPEFTGLENRKLYKMSEIVDALEKTFGNNPSPAQEAGGGTENPPGGNANNSSTTALIVTIAGIGIIGIVTLRLRRKHVSDNQ